MNTLLCTRFVTIVQSKPLKYITLTNAGYRQTNKETCFLHLLFAALVPMLNLN
jgi:hypothetical protein